MITPDLTAREARLRLALPCSSFWREIWRAVARGIVRPMKWGKTYTFAAAEIEALRASRMIVTREDLLKMKDGRRRVAMGRTV